jgi:hypothetical protein
MTCRRSLGSPLPRRVIDVESREACLRETTGLREGYITLSHCWKNSLPFKTIKSNLQRHLGSLPWNALPLAFREAIELTRALRYRYLWIDSICIVQDDPEEWAVEARRMANYFENSALTIVLHQDSPGASSFPDPVCSYSWQNIQCHAIRLQPCPMDVNDGELATRGWCFQVGVAIYTLQHPVADRHRNESCRLESFIASEMG